MTLTISSYNEYKRYYHMIIADTKSPSNDSTVDYGRIGLACARYEEKHNLSSDVNHAVLRVLHPLTSQQKCMRSLCFWKTFHEPAPM